jgi:eukaryotic-like serine/threonine-protein kinase
MQILGARYRLAERLGSGGMSVVWRGYDELLGRLVAIKVLSPNLATDEFFRDRIRHEAMACARSSHPNIVSVYDYGEAVEPDGTTVPYLVMELVEGHSLAQRLAGGPLPWRLALEVCAEVAAALAAAHELGLVHRDVTPANVLMSRTGAKVVDFGISAAVGARESKAPLLGTPAYLAPERLAGTPAQPATDVYALGVLLFQVLTGSLPWSAETVGQMLAQHRHAEPAPLPPIPDLPPEIAPLYERCLAKQPASRPDSAEVARQLATAIGLRVAVPAPAEAIDTPDTVPAGGPTDRPEPGVPATAVLQPPTAPLRQPWSTRYLRPAAAVLVAVVLLGLSLDLWLGPPLGRTGGGDRPAVAASAPAPTGTPGCAVRYRVRTVWDTGFTVDVTLTNTGSTAVSAWVLTFTFPDDQRVVQGWNGSFAQFGARVTVRSADYNAQLTPAGSATLGFNGAYQAQNGAPRGFTLNGVTCAAST